MGSDKVCVCVSGPGAGQGVGWLSAEYLKINIIPM